MSFYVNGGDLTSKNPPNALIFCMHVEEIRLYSMLKFWGKAIILNKKTIKMDQDFLDIQYSRMQKINAFDRFLEVKSPPFT